jgi:Uri superfamily endonuclease
MKGTYNLLIKVPKNIEVRTGKLGKINFNRGFYAYVGSALNGLEKRIERHLRKEKKLRWHIDYLLENAEIAEVIYAETDSRTECNIAGKLNENLESVKKFGCSDCKCKSHLFHCRDFDNLKDLILISFKENGLKPGFYNQDNKG